MMYTVFFVFVCTVCLFVPFLSLASARCHGPTATRPPYGATKSLLHTHLAPIQMPSAISLRYSFVIIVVMVFFSLSFFFLL